MFGSNWQRLAQLHVDTLLACRSCSEQRHSMLGMRWTPTPGWPPGCLLAQEQLQGRHPQTCHPCCWMGASATLACL